MPEHRESVQVTAVEIRGAHPDLVIAQLAARQHGVVARRQLLAHGLTRALVEERLASGRLIPLHRGVYAVGHDRLRREGYWLAAVLAVGPGAVLSHRDAASLHEIRFSNGTRIDVSTNMERRHTKKVRIHGRRVLDAAEITTVSGIPVTTVARTLVDLAELLTHDQLSKALSEADRRGKLDLRAVKASLLRTRGRHGPGPARMRAVLDEHATLGATLTRSELEDRFVALLKTHRLPRPRLNVWIPEAGVEVDALWPTERLAVELDGYAYHSNRRVFQRDRAKANDLVDLGYRVLRFTHRDVTREGTDVADRLRRALTTATPALESAAPLP